ncbi:MAG: aminoacetone oxidase family FAD-binding enzyme, partial [Anaerolineae bacterium]
MNACRIVIIGGGAAGFFAAIACKEANPFHSITILEKNRQILTKVKISGGGRCNVTHACFNPALLVKNYPRGGSVLRSAFARFQPRDTVEWFAKRGVSLKIEKDGRMFPVTDSSSTIISLLSERARDLKVSIQLESSVDAIFKKESGSFDLCLSRNQSIDSSTLECDIVLLATGSHPYGHSLAESLGHRIVPCVPSLFSFTISDSRLADLAGVSLADVNLRLQGISLRERGPLLITHSGLSGPAILRLSSWGARFLHEKNYQTSLVINWIPNYSEENIRKIFKEKRELSSSKMLASENLFELPKSLWKKLVASANIPEERLFAHFSKQEQERFIQELLFCTFSMTGKSTHKEEFVTCGGVALDQVEFKT